MAAMARASSGLQYPDRFYAAASYAGFDGSPKSSSKAVRSKFSDEAALLLYGLYQQVRPTCSNSAVLVPLPFSSTVLLRFEIGACLGWFWLHFVFDLCGDRLNLFNGGGMLVLVDGLGCLAMVLLVSSVFDLVFCSNCHVHSIYEIFEV